MNGRAKSSSGAPRATPGAPGNWPGDASLSRVADACALAAAAIGVLVLAGWLLGIEPLKCVLPGLVAMKFNTALAFAVGGAALWWRQRPALRLGLGALVAVFGALALGEYFSGGDWGIDQLFFREIPAAPAAAFPPGRMAPATAVCFLLCGVALICSRRSKSGPQPGSMPAVEAAPWRGYAVDVLAFGAAAIAGFVLIGYATGTESLRHLPGFISMALNTAAAFVLLAAGILCAVPGGMMAQAVRSRDTGRTLWLGFGLLTLLLAMLGVTAAARLGSIGEALAVHDSRQAAVLRDLQNTEVLILALLVVGVLIAMVISMLVGRAVLGHEQALCASEERFRLFMDNSPTIAWLKDEQGRHVYLSKTFEDRFGVRLADWRGKTDAELWPAAMAEVFRKNDLAVLAADHAIEMLEETTDPAGSRCYWLSFKFPLQDAAGNRFVGGIGLDITERKQADEKLAWLASFPGLNPNPIAEIDLASGEVKYANSPVERLFPDLIRLGIAHPFLAGAREQADAARTNGEPVVREVAVGDALYLETLNLTPDRQRLRVYGLDITARKRVEEELRYHANLIDNVSDAVISTDRELNIRSWNRAAERMYGWQADEVFGLKGSNVLQTMFPEGLSREAVAKDIFEKGNWEGELIQRTKDGREITVHARSMALKDEAGKVIGGVSISSDITERMRAEEALRESRDYLEKLFGYANAPIICWDPRRAITRFNPAFEHLTGYAADEVIGRDLSMLFPDGTRDDSLAMIERALTERWEVVEIPIKRKDGETRVALWNSANVYAEDGKTVLATIAQGQDITELKKMEALRQALAEQDRVRLGAAVEQASDSVVMFDLDGTIRYVNAAFEAFNRIPRDRAIGRSYYELFGDQAAVSLVQQAFARGQAWHGPITRQTPDGRTIDLEVTVSPISDPAGTIIGGLVTARDVTRQNALQEQIRQAQKMEALGTLAGGITHDFNNILGTIVINTELALLDLDPSDPARRPLPVVLQAANRGKELVKQIITFSRQRAWERKPVEIAPVVREGLGLLRSTLPKDVVLRETIDDASGVVLADPSHIHQILVNLCQNAALAMRDCGERRLEVELEAVEADAAMAVRDPDLQPGPFVRLTVADTGCGMTPETMERIFEPFFTTRERGSGSGLGLSVVHGIVKSYGGVITVRSRPGQGSVFTIYLPRLGEDVLAAGTERPSQPARGQARILVVEDEEAQRTSLTRGLERLGYEVTAEPEGRSALAAFGKDPGTFDLVITDQIMPRMSGVELAAELMKVRPDVPVILCTGFSEKVDDGTVGTSGIRELVMKPFSITEISQLIRKVLEKEDRSASSASSGPSLKKPGRRAARPFKVRP